MAGSANICLRFSDPRFVKAQVKVRHYHEGSHAILHGPRCLGRYTTKASPWISKTPLESARRHAYGRHGQVFDLPTPPTGEQNQKQRTYDMLPKSDKLIGY